MKNRMGKLLVLLALVFVNPILPAQTNCALQDDDPLIFDITIGLDQNIHEVYCFFDFSSGLVSGTTTYSIASSGTFAINSSISPGGSIYSNDFDHGEGYYVELDSHPPGHLYIRRNADGSGLFESGDISAWTFTVTSISGSYDLTNVRAQAQNTASSPVSGAGVGVSACNTKPTVGDITAGISATAALTVNFEANDADAEDPSPDSITNYEWNYGNGQTATTTSNPHDKLYPADTVPASGTFNVTVRVQDSHGAWSDWSAAKAVGPNQAPTLTGINAPQVDTTTPLKVTFTGNTPNDPDGDSLQYLWNFGDGNSPATPPTNNDPIPRTYEADNPPAGYPATLQLRDAHGLLSPVRSVAVFTDDRPTADFAPGAGSDSPYATSTDGSIIYTITPSLLDLNPAAADDTVAVSAVKWDMNGNGIYDEAGDVTDNAAPFEAQTVPFESVGEHTIGVKSVAGNFESVSVEKTINVLPNPLMTFPRAKGVPYDSLKEPHIDGKLSGPDGQTESDGITIYGEHGWRGAHLLRYEGGSLQDGTVQFLKSRDNQFIYIGVEVMSDNTPSTDDVIVLGFRDGPDDRLDPAYTEDGAKLMYIEPVDDGSDLEAVVSIYQYSAGSWVDTAVTPGELTGDGWEIGLEAPSAADPWTLELKIPLSGSGLAGLGEEFLFFYNIFKGNSGGTVDQIHWPRDVDDVPGGGTTTDIVAERDSIFQFTPLWWGRGNRSDSVVANGLALPDYSYVGVKTNPGDTTLSSTIEYFEDNTFVARVVNNSQKDIIHNFGSGDTLGVETLPVSDVTVTFKVANWGIPSVDPIYWDPIPASGNPIEADITAPTSSYGADPHKFDISSEVPPPVHYDELSFIWKPSTDTDPIDYLAEEDHQCILVELSTPREANIVTKSVHRNMNFDGVNDVIFIHPAVISAFGYGLPAGGAEGHRILLRIFTNTWEVQKNELKKIQMDEKHTAGRDIPYFFETLPYLLEADNTLSFIEYIIKGYLYTGNKLVVRGEERESVMPIGSYGHVVRHDGLVEEWDFFIEGAEKIDRFTYIITIPPDETATIVDNVKGIEAPKWRVHTHGGAAFPVDPMANSNGIGANFIIGGGRHLTPEISVLGLFGFNALSAGSTGAASTLMSLSANGRYHRVLNGRLSMYAGLGPGVYFDSGFNFEPGMNAGAGIDLRLLPWLVWETGADIHWLFTSGSKYLHVHTGLLFRF